MTTYRWWAGTGLVCLILIPQLAPSQQPDPGRSDAVGALAARIDHHILQVQKAKAVKAAPLADDAEFLRRVTLDLGGRIPRVSEVRAFLASTDPNKRRAVVERLLAGPHYVNHFSAVWRALLLPQANDQRTRYLAPQMEGWLRERLVENVPYDRMVRELVTANVLTVRTPGQAGARPTRLDTGAVPFYQANQYKPEELASATSRLFLGVKLECAQCHSHPFAEWSQEQFWQFAAFYSGFQNREVRPGVFVRAGYEPMSKEIEIPGKDKKVQARFLDGSDPHWSDQASTREVLADWLTSKDNPFFARAAVNRLWEHFFGIGLVDPVDEMNRDNPASHPELLDELAHQFVAQGFDVKFLIRAITSSKTYQRTSRQTDASQADPRVFARMAVKGLTPEQIFDSLALATGYREPTTYRQRYVQPNSARGEFLTRFANESDRRTEQQTSILQALALMNGTFIADATSLEKSETLAAVANAPFLDTEQRLDTLYLATLSRPMRSEERERLLPYVQRGGPSGDSGKALADVFWTLLNSSEFIFNH